MSPGTFTGMRPSRARGDRPYSRIRLTGTEVMENCFTQTVYREVREASRSPPRWI